MKSVAKKAAADHAPSTTLDLWNYPEVFVDGFRVYDRQDGGIVKIALTSEWSSNGDKSADDRHVVMRLVTTSRAAAQFAKEILRVVRSPYHD